MSRRTDLPHVTDILKGAGLVDTSWFTDEARDRGTAIHRACELWDQGYLDEDTLDPRVRPGFNLYRQFLAEMRPDILSIEEGVEVPGVYCGTLDRRIILNDKEGVLDLKGQPDKANPIQLAGYAQCFDRPMARWNLYLRAGPRYKLVEYKHPERREHDAVWRACVTVTSWRRKHGIK